MNNFDQLTSLELTGINAGCGLCKTGAVLIIAGGFIAGGIPGGSLAIVGTLGCWM